ncbi:MAG: GNAT family N-acetyltransferase [Candidatus Viridilinea halotolerans]|uniref:GNAT family N-acetyltransferase n=1 Tax=Candidatus Viridilinea halotolerans TaxID=2491704 RepID=A0A426TY67_9CHLR|nr:MAG: GNAT family N-acetyltransferase [Candidatus Viridilinea halotolerans]
MHDPQTPCQLRPARDEDFGAVAHLFAALHQFNAGLDRRFRLAEGWEQLLHEHFVRTHAAAGALWLLAWSADEPVGLLLMESHSDSPIFAERRWAELVALYVAPEQRGTPLGYQLVAAAQAWATTKGFDRIQLYVTAGNEQAKQFYARCGLVPTQEIWRLDLTPPPDAIPPPDPSTTAVHPRRHSPELGHHQLAMELSEEDADKEA